MKNITQYFKPLLSLCLIGIASFFWVRGFLSSPLWSPGLKSEGDIHRETREQNSPDYQQEAILANEYWLRYKDIKEDKYWGKNGPQNIRGPRKHFELFGKKEGRIFGPLPQPEDLQRETQLARAYWQRYPDIAQSTVWGENSQLGILGPRDHFKYLGRSQGKAWGVQPGK